MTYTKCEEDHKVVRRTHNDAVIARLDSPRQFWNNDTASVNYIPIENLNTPSILHDNEYIYIFFPHLAPIYLFPLKTKHGTDR